MAYFFNSISEVVHMQCFVVALCIVLACWCLQIGNCVLWADIFCDRRTLKNTYRISF